MKRILILTADAGFGHRSAAKALAASLNNQSEKIEVKIQNLMDDPSTPAVLRNSQTNYDYIVREMPKFYELTYDQSERPLPASLSQVGLSAMLFTAFEKAINDFRPDAIINTYTLYHAPAQTWYLLNEGLPSTPEDAKKSLLQQTISKRKKEGKSHIPFITVVTDLVSVHVLWYSLLSDCYCVATESVRQEAIEYGILPSRIACTGIPVNEKFVTEKRSKQEIRKDFGLAPDIPLILAVGSKRVTSLMDYLNVINHAGFKAQVVMAAGGDEDLYHAMLRNNWHIPVKIYNFCDQLAELMMASDLILTKAGGLVTSESLAAGLPMLLADVLPGQETGNAKLVESSDAGKVLTTQYSMLENYCHMMMDDGKLLREMQKNARRIGKPDSSQRIIDIVLKLINYYQGAGKEKGPYTENL